MMVLLFVSFATFGAANGSLFVGSRLIHVASREGELPDVLSGLHVTAKTPVPAIIFQVTGHTFSLAYKFLLQLHVQGWMKESLGK